MKIVIVCSGKGGASYMRGEQIYQELGNDSGYKLELIKSKGIKRLRDIKNSIVLIVKVLVPTDLLVLIKKNKNVIIYDIIDAYFEIHKGIYHPSIFRNKKIMKQIDYIIVVNNESLNHFNNVLCLNNKCKVICIYHHWDPDILQYNTYKNINDLCICYVGYHLDGRNCLYFNELDDINILGNKIDSDKNCKYNCHYNIRKEDGIMSKYKSSVKLSTAAAMNCNIITTRDKCITELLNPDYPYITDSNIKNVTKMIQYTKNTYNTPVWFKGLEYLKEVKNKTSLEVIIKDYKRLFDIIKI
jgi:hypothetical protein